MEKRVPHTPLPVIQGLIDAGRVEITYSAAHGGAALGLDSEGILQVARNLTPADFYKSMTTHADHRAWQDVYRADTGVGKVYVKFMVTAEVLIVSFKEL
jgi:motility quorum-sensing regulator/GCU-specific mRNA interferase toxin